MKQIFTFIFSISFCFHLCAQQQESIDSSPGKKPSVKKIESRKNISGPSPDKNNVSPGSGSMKGDKPVNFNGQWKGGFNESSYGFSGMMGSDVDYVLELQTTGSVVTGYSYTYFNEGLKKYYTICKLSGTVNRSTREITVTEIERVKYNTPPGFSNCFQIHKLHYVKDTADMETLRGTWMPAPNQTGDCGYGSTVLSRRLVKPTPLEITPAGKSTAKTITTQPKKQVVTSAGSVTPKITHKPAITHQPVASRPTIKSKTLLKPKTPLVKNDDQIKNKQEIPETNKTAFIAPPVSKFEPRRKDIIKTIPIVQDNFKVDFYDNGEVDGDSITVFYNNKIVLSHKMLSTKAISLTLALDANVKENIITMYADNLGTIPPNTALMIVTDGDKRYEVRISSDTEKSGSVVFVHGDK